MAPKPPVMFCGVRPSSVAAAFLTLPGAAPGAGGLLLAKELDVHAFLLGCGR